MSEHRFCRVCTRKTEHDRYTDIMGVGNRAGIAERLFFGVVSLGASEVMADRYLECQECGKVSRA